MEIHPRDLSYPADKQTDRQTIRQTAVKKVRPPEVWFGSPAVRASNLRLNGREFDPRPPAAALSLGWY